MYGSLMYNGKTVDFKSRLVFRAFRSQLTDEKIPHHYIIYGLKTGICKGVISMMLFALSLSVFAQSANTDLFDTVFNTVAHDLGFDTMDVRIRIIDGNMHDGLKPTDEPAACTARTRKKSYVIYIYFALDRDRMIRALIHEFVHVRQMATGRMLVKRDSIIFNGVGYTKFTPYDQRPFEIEAIHVADILFTKYF